MNEGFKHTDLTGNFTKVSNNLIGSLELSPTEKLIYIYISGQKKGWNFSNDRIAKELDLNSKTVRKHLQSLEKKGLLQRCLRSNRRYDYLLTDYNDVMGDN